MDLHKVIGTLAAIFTIFAGLATLLLTSLQIQETNRIAASSSRQAEEANRIAATSSRQAEEANRIAADALEKDGSLPTASNSGEDRFTFDTAAGDPPDRSLMWLNEFLEWLPPQAVLGTSLLVAIGGGLYLYLSSETVCKQSRQAPAQALKPNRRT